MPSTTAQDARRELADELSITRNSRMLATLVADNLPLIIDALRAEPARGAEEMREKAAKVCDLEARDQGHCYIAHKESGAQDFADAAESSRETALTLAAAIRALPLPQGSEGGGI